MFYEYIRTIDPLNQFIYIVAIIISILFFKRLALSSHIILGIIVGVLAIYYFNGKTQATNANFIMQMKQILSMPILKPHLYKDLYRDSELVIFLDNYKEYHSYNPDGYNMLVRNVNDFLITANTVQLSSEFQADYEILRDTKVKILNIFHSFIYRLPHSSATLEKYQRGLNKLESLLNYHIDNAHRTVILRGQAEGISIKSRFPHRNHPKHYDATWNDRFDYL